MKKHLTKMIFIFPLFFIGLMAQAQLNYLPAGYSTSLGTYTDLGTNGDTIPIFNTDDEFSGTLPIGFTFNFNGAPYDSFIFSTNGFIKLGTIAPSRQYLFTTFAQPPQNGPFTAATSPAPLASDSSMLFAFGQDLIADSSMPHYRYFTDGSPGSRICTIQWKSVRDKLQNSTVGLYDTINFQIRLYEGSNIVEYVYGDWYTSIVASAVRFSAIGIVGKSVTTANQNMYLIKGSTVAWSGAAAVSGFYINNAVNYRNPISTPAGAAPGSGRTFSFVPLVLNDAAVVSVYSQGKIALPFYQPQSITASISNPGINNLINLDVTLTVSGTNSHTETITIPTLNAGANTTVTFTPYAPLNLGASLVTVSVPSDDNNLNNTKLYSMSITNTEMAYTDTLNGISGGNGITIPNFWGCKFFVSGRAIITQVKSPLQSNSDAVGDTICGMVMDSVGKILARSPNYIVQPSDLGTVMVFNIAVPPYIQNQTIIGGIAGGTSINGLNYFLGTSQTETPIRTPNPFYFLTSSQITNANVGNTWATPGLVGNQATRLMMQTIIGGVPNDDVQISAAGPINNLKVPVGVNIPLTAVVKNLGLSSRPSGIDVKYTVNGGPVVGPIPTATFINPDDTLSVVFTGLNALNFVTPGNYTIKIYTELVGDAIPGNDTLTLTYTAITPTTLPYRIDNGILTNWTIQNSVPALLKSQTVTQANGVSTSNTLWADNITTFNAQARALSPVFNFTGIVRPVLHFNLAHAPNTFVGTDDTMQVEVSTDGGFSFTPLYTRSSQLSALPLGTTTATGLTYIASSASQWRHETVDLSGYTGNNFIVVAFRFKSASGNSVYISNVTVTDATNFSKQAVSSIGPYFLDNVTVDFTGIGAVGGEISIAKYNSPAFSNASPVFATNGVATTNNAAVFTPDVVNDSQWFSITYSGIGTGIPASNAPYFISYSAASLPGILNNDSVYIMKRNNYSSPWVAQSTTVSGSLYTAGPLTGFSDYTLGSVSATNPLPVQWLLVKAKSIHPFKNLITWSTASETDNAFFTVEKSVDGIQFTALKQLRGANNSNKISSYSYVDELTKAMSGSMYYRIKQTDNNGKFTYSSVVVVKPVHYQNELTITNPFSQYPSVFFNNLEESEKLTIAVVDISGKTIFNKSLTLSVGKNTINLAEFELLRNGMYFIQLTIDNKETKTQKLIKSE